MTPKHIVKLVEYVTMATIEYDELLQRKGELEALVGKYTETLLRYSSLGLHHLYLIDNEVCIDNLYKTANGYRYTTVNTKRIRYSKNAIPVTKLKFKEIK